jgi:hypothetical protein
MAPFFDNGKLLKVLVFFVIKMVPKWGKLPSEVF